MEQTAGASFQTRGMGTANQLAAGEGVGRAGVVTGVATRGRMGLHWVPATAGLGAEGQSPVWGHPGGRSGLCQAVIDLG
jgi:hypothetical protein